MVSLLVGQPQKMTTVWLANSNLEVTKQDFVKLGINLEMCLASL